MGSKMLYAVRYSASNDQKQLRLANRMSVEGYLNGLLDVKCISDYEMGQRDEGDSHFFPEIEVGNSTPDVVLKIHDAFTTRFSAELRHINGYGVEEVLRKGIKVTVSGNKKLSR